MLLTRKSINSINAKNVVHVTLDDSECELENPISPIYQQIASCLTDISDPNSRNEIDFYSEEFV